MTWLRLLRPTTTILVLSDAASMVDIGIVAPAVMMPSTRNWRKVSTISASPDGERFPLPMRTR